ncbi:MAG: DMT family transporter, partial [Marinomonas sp.]
ARPRPFLALGIRLLAAGALATMAMLAKLGASKGVHLAELIFWRQTLTLAAVTLILALSGRILSVKTTRLGAHARRAMTGLIGMFFVYGAVILLPLAEATAISFTAPFFAVMISVILFGEKVGRYRWGAVILGFAGVLLITQPNVLPGSSGMIDPFGAAVGLIAAALVALISFQVQDLNKSENPWTIVFWFTAISAPIMALIVPFFIGSHDAETWGIIIAMAAAGALGQILLTTSLRFGSAAVIIVMDYTSLLWATLYGASVFGTAPSDMLWFGAPLIIGAGLLIAYRERVAVKSAGRSPDKGEDEAV